MLNDITIGQYVKGNSILHRLDPRTKIIGMLGIMVALFLINKWTGLIYAAVVVFAVLALSKVSISYYIKGIKPLLFIYSAVISWLDHMVLVVLLVWWP